MSLPDLHHVGHNQDLYLLRHLYSIYLLHKRSLERKLKDLKLEFRRASQSQRRLSEIQNLGIDVKNGQALPTDMLSLLFEVFRREGGTKSVQNTYIHLLVQLNSIDSK